MAPYGWSQESIQSMPDQGIYLFYLGHFGFDFTSLSEMSLSLRLFFLLELLVCCYGNIWPDEIGYYLSHRYWAGNWVQAFFWVKRTPERLGNTKKHLNVIRSRLDILDSPPG